MVVALREYGDFHWGLGPASFAGFNADKKACPALRQILLRVSYLLHCIKLTNIQQSDVDNAQLLNVVLQQHEEWLKENQLIGEQKRNFVPVTWSDWDLKVQLHQECEWREIQKASYFNRWIDLKKEYKRHYGQSYSLRISVEKAGLTWEGHRHSGIADAQNTARLLIQLCEEGLILNVTGKFDQTLLTKGSKQFKIGSQNKGQGQKVGGSPSKDSDGNLLCGCGSKATLRVVKKPGVNNGKEFYSCGNFTMTTGSRCNFFLWKDKVR
eukprot:TRINITY_DN10623_c0_g1_i4.p1 TRINITY_DN10623_c0_g1~~TRINITY_DN10623_c0_g1_i4.p1  ORF type:complete len:267 (-),score=17.28 TRINITY_DN10623_c0_g1_i4:206-1006(-)